MAYLLVKFSGLECLAQVAAELARLEFAFISPDWHEAKAVTMREIAKTVDVKLDSAPFKSLYADQERSGTTYGVSIQTSRGNSMAGQLRASGLLVGAKGVDCNEVRRDANIAQVVRALKELGCLDDVEIG